MKTYEDGPVLLLLLRIVHRVRKGLAGDGGNFRKGEK